MTSTIDQYNGSIVPAEAIAEAQRSIEAIYDGGERGDLFGQEYEAQSGFLETIPEKDRKTLSLEARDLAISPPEQILGETGTITKNIAYARAQMLGPEQFDLAA